MKKQQGSSETIRETNSQNFNHYLKFGTPSHKPKPDIHFLEWFIGFFEAEGSFLQWPQNQSQKLRFGIEITQKDPKLMYKIRTRLGFGRVVVWTRETNQYARYYIHDAKNLERIIYLLNGNLVTDKKRNQFQTWLTRLNQQRQNQSKRLYPEIDFQFNPSFDETAWLAGFLEGDGGFWVSPHSIVRTNKDLSQNFSLRMKFYLTQEDLIIVKLIAEHFGFFETNISQIRNGHSNKLYYRFETNSLQVHLKLLDYLNQFPFLGKRSIQLTRWSRLVNYRIYKYEVTEKSVQKVIRLIAKTKKD